MSELYKVLITPEAQDDIRDVVLYIAKVLQAPASALKLKDSFMEEITSLSHMPQRIRLIDEQPWRDSGVRKTRVKNYYIYFIIDEAEKAVKIIAVIYIGRDQAKQLSKLQ